MRTRVVLGGIGLTMLLLLVVLWRPRAGGGGLASEAARSSSATLQSAPESRARDANDVDATASSLNNHPRDAVASTAALGPTCCIRVVDASSRAPVPAARAWLQREEVQVGSPDWNLAMRRFN